jgi:uncharacterized membrane protein
MATNYPRTTAQIAGHPIHPMLVPFPIVLFIGTLVCDLVFWRTGNRDWAQATPWLLAFGIGFAAAAAVTGVIEFLGDHRIPRLHGAWWHATGNAVIVVLETVNLWLRCGRDLEVILPTGLLLSLVCVGLLAVTGWIGGKLVYRYRVGVRHQDEPL